MRAVIYANGKIANPALVKPLLKRDDFIVSADGGMRYIHALNLQPQLIIGDMDSISPGLLGKAEHDQIQVVQFPAEKDETDLELAILEVQSRGFNECLVVGALGGRTDQMLANIWLLAKLTRKNFRITYDDGHEQLALALETLTLVGEKGDTVSLIPFSQPVTGISTEGLQYPLCGETLFPEKTRGISNVMMGGEATIRIESGRLLCIHRRDRKERKVDDE